jgi:hypothetical protein
MLEYTAKDVLYLPKIYDLIRYNCQVGVYKSLTFENIKYECNKYLEYCRINLSIKNFNKINIERDKVVEGFLKYKIIIIRNFQKNCIFVQLNIGYNGILTSKKSISFITSNHKVGDIINFKILKYNFY